MEIKVLGVCGSPIKGGNTEAFLREALKTAQEFGGVKTELLTLAGRKIENCRHCNWCLAKQAEGEFCAIKDDMTEIFPKVLDADALLIATPVYTTRLSAYLATFLDRFRIFGHGNFYKGKLANKVGGALAVGWYRNLGIETALLSIVSPLLTFGMLPVNCPWGSPYGAAGLSSEQGTGRFDPKDKLGVLKDDFGLSRAQMLVERLVEVSRIVKGGQEKLRRGNGSKML